MIAHFYDQDGNEWNYDTVEDTTDCELEHSYHVVEDGIIYFCEEGGGVIDYFDLIF